MALELESFSRLKAPLQARDVCGLIKSERGWLVNIFPGTVDRYRDYPHAVKNIGRLAQSELLHAFILRKDKVTQGLATIILDQSIVHPEEGPRWGVDLDYWLKKGSSRIDHEYTADALIQAAIKLEASRRQRDMDYGRNASAYLSSDYPMFATMRPGHEASPIGLADYLRPLGEPASLTTLTGADPYGVTKVGANLQLYYATLPVSLRTRHA